jgi:hypothetical protein
MKDPEEKRDIEFDIVSALRGTADVLRNTWNNEEGETPYIEYCWRHEHPEHGDIPMRWPYRETPSDSTAYPTGIDVLVADAQIMAFIPLNEGQFMDDIAHAIVDGGMLMRKAADRILELEARLKTTRQKEGLHP